MKIPARRAIKTTVLAVDRPLRPLPGALGFDGERSTSSP